MKPTMRLRRRKLMQRMQVVAGAASVALVLVGGAAIAHYDATAGHAGIDRRSVTPPRGVSIGGSTSVPSDWRVESYKDVTLRVPPTWGWGGAPTSPAGDGALYDCGDSGAYVVPGSDGYGPVDEDTPFAGRPVMMSDACRSGTTVSLEPTTDAVWFGSPLPIGLDESGPLPSQTFLVGGQNVTVFSADATLRLRILESATIYQWDGNGCPAAPIWRPVPGPGGDAVPVSLSVCVYDSHDLLWSATQDGQRAREYVDAFSRGSATYDAAAACAGAPTSPWVAIGVHDTDPTVPARWDVVHFDCPAIVGAYTIGDQGKRARTEAPLEPATVQPWWGGGVKAYVAGPTDPGQLDPALGAYFRGMLG